MGTRAAALFCLQRIYFFFARSIDARLKTGVTMIIAPHPDDETLGCAATIMQARSHKQDVRIVIVMDGGLSSTSAVYSPEQLAELRRGEAIHAAEIMGCSASDITFLGFRDSSADKNVPAIQAALLEQVQHISPNQIFSPYGDDGNPDHRAIAEAIENLFRSSQLPCSVYEYPIWFWPQRAMQHLLKPRLMSRLRRVATRGYLDRKSQAIAAHRSQVQNITNEPGWWTLGEKFYKKFLIPQELFFEKE